MPHLLHLPIHFPLGPSMEGSQSPATAKSNKRRQRKPNSAKKAASKESKDFRYLEIVKLIRAHLPITINGIAVSKVIELHLESKAKAAEESREATPEAEEKPKKRSLRTNKKQKMQIVGDYIQKVIARDPLQPIYLSFMIAPSDPDFPFELDTLKFNLTIPSGYPRNAKALPSLIVLNNDIPKGFAVNIERGFKEITRLAKVMDTNKKKPSEPATETNEETLSLVDGKGLLSQIQTLDKYLEVFLKQEKRQTMKFVSFKPSNTPAPLATPEPTPAPPSAHREVNTPNDIPPNVSEEDLKKRSNAIEEMTTKLGKNVKLFNKSSLETRYKVMIPIPRTRNLPQLWTTANDSIDVFISIPIEYPQVVPKVTIPANFSTNLLVAKKPVLQDCGKTLVELVEEAKKGEKHLRANLEARIDDKDLDLVGLVNWMSNNVSELVLEPTSFTQWRKNMSELMA